MLQNAAAIPQRSIEGLAESTYEVQLSCAPYLRRIWMQDGDRPSWACRLPNSGHGGLLTPVEREVRASDLLAIINTSGATATPKSVVHTHGSLVRHACAMAKARSEAWPG